MQQEGVFQSPELRNLVGEMVREVVAEFVAENELRAREISLVERLINVEEEIRCRLCSSRPWRSASRP